MEEKSLFYEESGQTNLLGMVFAYTAVIVFTFIMGFLYEVFIRIIPFVYINFLLTFGYGAAVGFFVMLISRIVKCRSRKGRIFLVAFAGLAANFFQWAAFFSYITDMQIPTIKEYFYQIEMCLNPDYLFDFLGFVMKYGVWGFSGGTVNGFLLAIVWAVEALMIWGIAIAIVWKSPKRPYSELHGKWYERRIIDHDFEFIAIGKRMVEKLTENPLIAIQSLQKGDAYRHTQISLFYLENENTQYLTIEKVYVDRKNSGKKKTELLVNNFAIDSMTAREIMNTFPYRKGRIDIL